MRGSLFLALIGCTAIGLTVTTPRAEAQVAVEVGQLRNVLTATTMPRPMLALPTVIMVPNGLQAACLLAPARGFMAPPISGGM